MCHLDIARRPSAGVLIATLLVGCATTSTPESRTADDVFELRSRVAQLVRPVRESSGCHLTVLYTLEVEPLPLDPRQSIETTVGLAGEGAECDAAIDELNTRADAQGFRFAPAGRGWEIGRDPPRNQDLIHRIDPENEI